MNRIRILPDILVNKIAAGEVVERPSSVVKELIENALDAGGTRILVEIENGGKDLIRVSDNGTGMRRDDALLSIERHATSKIYRDDDLFSIRTLGFRGEALPSIASVSRFSLITQEPDADFGVDVRLDGGKLISVKETGAAAGTVVTVRQLFFNTPARRKFMKTASTEMGHIAEIVSVTALGRHDVHFRLDSNGRTLHQYSAVLNREERAIDILGATVRGRLNAVDYQTDSIDINGWAAAPDAGRNTTRYQFVYVNGRYVRDRLIQHAVMDAFSGRLMKGQFPVVALWIQVPYDTVDVNVHPTKMEIRFANPGAIHSAIVTAVSNGLGSGSRIGSSDTPDIGKPLFVSRQTPSPHNHDWQKPVTGDKKSTFFPDFSETVRFFPPASADSKPVAEQPRLWPQAESPTIDIIGQFDDTYIVCQKGNELILIDQHAAHERILYERLKKRQSSGSQYLLIPETLECGIRETRILEAVIPDLHEYGLDIELFGRNTFVIKAIPALLPPSEARNLVCDIMDRLSENEHAAPSADRVDACLKLMACHGAIRAGQPLSFEQIKSLIQDIETCHAGDKCPHGRPTWISWSKTDIEKRFGRIVT